MRAAWHVVAGSAMLDPVEPSEHDDPVHDLERHLRARRWRMAIAAVVFVLGVGAVGLAAITLRERQVYLIGGHEVVDARVDGTRFRLVDPHSASLRLSPGSHALEARRGPARDALSVTFAPWSSKVAAPVAEGQCLIVASGSQLYEGGRPEQLFVHAVTHEAREVALPFGTDVVATHPCRLPGAIRLLDTIVLIATVPCAEAPRTDEEARARVLATMRACE